MILKHNRNKTDRYLPVNNINRNNNIIIQADLTELTHMLCQFYSILF